MSNELFAGLTAEEANKALCDEMNKRVPNRKYVVEMWGDHINVWEEVMSDAVAPFTYSHDTLQLLLDVLTVEELHRMTNLLGAHYANHVDATQIRYDTWLIKRDLHAFACAVLVAVGAGKPEAV